MTLTEPFSGPATGGDVARRAGVSRSTVSSILNGNDARFPESTRARVRAAAQELDYRPSAAARSLVSGISDTIIVLVPRTSFGSDIQDAIEQVALDTGQPGANVVVRFAARELTSSVSAIRGLRPLAVIDLAGLAPLERQMLEDHGTLVLPPLCTDGDETSPESAVVALQVDALLARGERTLWFASAPGGVGTYAFARRVAMDAYCARLGRPGPAEMRVPSTLHGAVDSLSALLGASPAPIGVACYNDDVALALLAAARELGVDVPGRLALVGVDSTTAGQLWAPPLTSVRADISGLMDTLSQHLRARLTGAPAPDPAPGSLRFSLVEGATT